jgi:hypothetical protein
MLLRLIAAAALLAAALPALADESHGIDMALPLGATKLVVGYEKLFGRQTGLVADVMREQERARGEIGGIAELGLRHELAGGMAISFGAGAGNGSPIAPRWRVVAGFEQTF